MILINGRRTADVAACWRRTARFCKSVGDVVLDGGSGIEDELAQLGGLFVRRAWRRRIVRTVEVSHCLGR